MKTFAHRGYHANAIENTMEAFASAVALGVDGIETDVRLLADGTLALFHDRCALDGRLLSSLRFRELSDLLGHQVTTLPQALSAGWDVRWDLEVKDPAVAEPLIHFLQNYSSRSNILVSSFFHPAVLEIVESSEVEGGLLIAHAPLDLSKWCIPHPRITRLIWDFETVTSDLLRDASGRGFINMVYGPITRVEHQTVRNTNVDTVITDHPEYLI
jgi:glycerophosphoryl diester phosphodiesterase